MTPAAPRLPWDAPLEPEPRRRPMRRATRARVAGAPWGGTTPQSAHASLDGARKASPQSVGQARRYLDYLKACGDRGATDWEAHVALQLERSTINARRNQLRAQVYADGFRCGPTGAKNTVWKLRRSG